jgi:hypothetical protein
MTASGVEFDMPRLSPFIVGLNNYHSWLLLLAVVLAIATGYGRRFMPDGEVPESSGGSLAGVDGKSNSART